MKRLVVNAAAAVRVAACAVRRRRRVPRRGYTATHGADLCFIADPWFRGMDLVPGPDGGVFIADWSDTGECHDHDGVHRSSGRIYRLVHGAAAGGGGPAPAIDVDRLDSAGLRRALFATDQWWSRAAVRAWQRRHLDGADLADDTDWLRGQARAAAAQQRRQRYRLRPEQGQALRQRQAGTAGQQEEAPGDGAGGQRHHGARR